EVPASTAAPVAMPSFSDEGFPVAAELLVEVAEVLNSQPAAVQPVAAAPVAAAPSPVAAPAKPAPAAAQKDPEVKESATAASSIRVNVDVIENLMTLISELVLT